MLSHENGNTQMGKTHNIQSGLEHSIKSLRLQPAAAIIATGHLINGRVTKSTKEPALNEHTLETNYAQGRN